MYMNPKCLINLLIFNKSQINVTFYFLLLIEMVNFPLLLTSTHTDVYMAYLRVHSRAVAS